MLSTILSSDWISGYSVATRRKQSRKRPSESFMMLALWTAVTRLRPCRRAYSKAKRAMRSEAFSVMIFRLSTTPGDHDVLEAAVEVLGVLAHDDQVDLLEAGGDARQRAQRAQVGVEVELLAELHVDRLEALAHLGGDRALSATQLRRIDSRTSGGSGLPYFSSASRAGDVALPFDLRRRRRRAPARRRR